MGGDDEARFRELSNKTRTGGLRSGHDPRGKSLSLLDWLVGALGEWLPSFTVLLRRSFLPRVDGMGNARELQRRPYYYCQNC